MNSREREKERENEREKETSRKGEREKESERERPREKERRRERERDLHGHPVRRRHILLSLITQEGHPQLYLSRNLSRFIELGSELIPFLNLSPIRYVGSEREGNLSEELILYALMPMIDLKSDIDSFATKEIVFEFPISEDLIIPCGASFPTANGCAVLH